MNNSRYTLIFIAILSSVGCTWPRQKQPIQAEASLCEIILQLRRDIRNSSVRPGQTAVGMPLTEAVVNLKLGLTKEKSGDFKITAAVPVASLGFSGNSTQNLENSITLTYKRVEGESLNDDATLGLPVGTLSKLSMQSLVIQSQVDAAISAIDAQDKKACDRK